MSAVLEPLEPTKERLLTAAERLFADFGIEAVSARRIALAADQKNQSAIRYHFGSKDDLIVALLSRRIAEINERRAALLEAPGISGDLRGLIGAIAVPLAERVERDASGSAYVQFLAHVFSDRQRRDLLIEHGASAALLRRIYGDLRRLTGALPDALFSERLRLLVGAIIHALADRERLRNKGDAGPFVLPQDAFISNLIDAGVGILTAPPSAATLASISVPVPIPAKEFARGTNG
jgi:AcrR family transcriptional regulator